MNKTLVASLVAAVVGVLASTSTFAQATDAQKQAAAEKWKQMTPEEQAAAKAKAKAKWDSMTPEEQAAAKQHFAEKHPQAAKRMEAKGAAPASTAAASAAAK
jgi:hypothetical protein